jgi:CheY-like chemotaxis protein
MDIILAIDDDVNLLKLIEAQLTPAGYSVTTALSGRSGLEMARTGSPALILLDIMMPDMDGFGVLHALQMEDVSKRIPVIMLSAQSERNSVVSAMRLGVSDYIVKPYDIHTLRQKIQSTINYSRMQRYSETESNGQTIRIMRGSGRTVIVFESTLHNPKLIEDAKSIFNKFFMTMSSKDELVFDLRGIPTVEKKDLPILKALMSLFPSRIIHIIAGRHYGEIVEDSSIGSDDLSRLYISAGDMEMELNQ